MTRTGRGATALAMLAMAWGGAASPRADVTDTLNLCSRDIKAWCGTVTPGQGRLLACLAAHEDKLSPGCASALYVGPEPLQALANSFGIIGRACGGEIDRLCGGVEPGEGRIRACLAAKKAEVTPGCRDALQSLGVLD